jgi:hypothetical protein
MQLACSDSTLTPPTGALRSNDSNRDRTLTKLAFGVLIILVFLTSAVAAFLAQQEGKLATDSVIVVIVVYGSVVILIELYRTWAHTQRVKVIMESAHKLQLRLAEVITEYVKQPKRVRTLAECTPVLTPRRSRSAARHYGVPPRAGGDFQRPVEPAQLARVRRRGALHADTFSPAELTIPSQSKTINYPEALRRLRTFAAPPLAKDFNNELLAFLLFAGLARARACRSCCCSHAISPAERTDVPARLQPPVNVSQEALADVDVERVQAIVDKLEQQQRSMTTQLRVRSTIPLPEVSPALNRRRTAPMHVGRTAPAVPDHV